MSSQPRRKPTSADVDATTGRRPYRSAVRTRQAEATRASVLSAARELFARTGYQATTIESIAAAAQVSVPTVYLGFQSKVGILTALVASATGDPRIRATAADALGETDPVRRMRKVAHVLRMTLELEGELLDVLWQAGSGHPDLLAAWRQMHDNRHRTLTAALAPALPAGPRQRSINQRFVDTVWALGSPETYRLLVSLRGWTPSQFESWLAESMVNMLTVPTKPNFKRR